MGSEAILTWDEFYPKHLPIVHSAYKRLISKLRVSTRDEFLSYLFTKLHKYKPDYAVSTFVYLYARSYRAKLIFDLNKRKPNLSNITVDDASCKSKVTEYDEDTVKKLYSSLDYLPERWKNLLFDRFFTEMSVKELRVKYKCTRSFIDMMTRKAIKRLREHLCPDMVDAKVRLKAFRVPLYKANSTFYNAELKEKKRKLAEQSAGLT